MGHAVIPKSRIRELLDSLRKEYRVVAPVMDIGALEFKEIRSADQVRLSDEVAYKSPKEFFFPQVEKFLRFDKNGELIEEKQNGKTVIFGVRPCDLEALKILTAVFTGGKFDDVLFAGHLENTVVIGMGCVSEKPGCFCGDRGINKNSSRECDLFLTDMGDYYSADILSKAGEYVVNNFLPETEPIGDVESSAAGSPADIRLLELDTDENTLFNKIDWERISETCMGCGTCTYVCPTCHCFEFKDAAEKEGTSRYRCWDSCMYPKFTLHTSGHNPRPSKKERYRQRVMHKYLYIKQNFGYTACTGCGRCIRSCPAGMNIKSVVSRIMEELT